MDYKIFKAGKKHAKDILRLINELADFEKLPPPNEKAKRRLVRDAFGRRPLFKILGVKSGKEVIAYAFYFFTYSSFLARKTLYLEDIFISERFRNKGIGKLLMKELIRISSKESCGRMEWCVLDWNKNAIKFYDGLGAKPLKDWIYYRIEMKRT